MPPRKKAAAVTAASSSSSIASKEKVADEQIMAYLRIRPHLGDNPPNLMPYLAHLSDTTVRMTDPSSSDPRTASRLRPSTVPPASTYTFSHVFPPETTQTQFFEKTTLPLVKDVLSGQNSLLFAYGATNSGKTFTVQGGKDQASAGIVPRTMDVIFNSIKDLHGDGKYRPARLYAVEPADKTDSTFKIPKLALPIADPTIAQVLGHDIDQIGSAESYVDPTVLKLDRNYEYTVYISYAEVYNEKIYDLLASVKNTTDKTSHVPPSSSNPNVLLMRQALPLKSSPPSDFPSENGASTGKYIAGLRQFRAHNAAQAKALIKLGQLHRRVFGTLANSESSRSHGLVIIKVMRCHRGEKHDPTAIQVSRLTLIDLAGSERTKHTQTTGDRLREAGNINKSLMVLGQCLEVMRSNQRKLATTLGVTGERMDTRDVKKGLTVIPFRHSKLTELLMDYFVGDGRAVMIVNVNPYDTGYDENSHVMKFAALAREVYIAPTPAPIQRIPQPTATKAATKASKQGPLTLRGSDIKPKPFSRKVTISGVGVGKKADEATFEVLEEDQDQADEVDDDDEEGANPLVDTLFEEIDSLRMQLFETEMRCAIIEADTRDEVMREMEDRMRKMEKMYSERLMREVEAHEMKMDAKIDMLHRSGIFGQSPMKQPTAFLSPSFEESDGEDAHDVELSLMDDAPTTDTESEMDVQPETPSPENGKKRKATAMPSKASKKIAMLLDEDEEEEEEEEEEVMESEDSESAFGTETEADEDEDDDDWKPSSAKTPRPKRATTSRPAPMPKAATPKGRLRKKTDTSADPPPKKTNRRTKASTTELEQKMTALAVGELDDDDEVAIVPVKKSKTAKKETDESQADSPEESKPQPVKKKKRQLGKNPVVTEEEIQRASLDNDTGVRRNIPRMIRAAKR